MSHLNTHQLLGPTRYTTIETRPRAGEYTLYKEPASVRMKCTTQMIQKNTFHLIKRCIFSVNLKESLSMSIRVGWLFFINHNSIYKKLGSRCGLLPFLQSSCKGHEGVRRRSVSGSLPISMAEWSWDRTRGDLLPGRALLLQKTRGGCAERFIYNHLCSSDILTTDTW